MSRFKIRYFPAVFVLLALPAFTCGIGPVLRDLIQRVEVLETESGLLAGQIGALEADLDVLGADVDALAAEVDAAPIVVDSNGETLGPVLFIEGSYETHWAQVQFDLPDLPLFFLRVSKDGILTGGVPTWFESDDCTGQAWIEAAYATFGVTAFVRGVTVAQTGIRTFYVADNSDTPQMISRRSLKNGSGDNFCEIDVAEVSAVRVTPVDLDAILTPPFRVTTWERMQALP